VRSDCGTENTALAASHMALRHQHHDEFRGEKSFRFGSSTTNTVSQYVRHVCILLNWGIYTCQLCVQIPDKKCCWYSTACCPLPFIARFLVLLKQRRALKTKYLLQHID